MINRFDKPYRLLSTHDPKKVLELFNIVNDLDTNDLLRYSLANQIPFDVTNEDGDCLIHEVINIDKRKASQHVKLNVIKFLVQNGVNPDTPNKMNQTPLHLACHLQLDVIVAYLLEINVNPNYTDNLGLYPFHYLFLGEIKPVDTTSEVLDFIPKKKIEKTNTQELLEIKKILWEFIKEEPFLKTIGNTVNELIKTDLDDDFEKRVDKIYELFDQLQKADPSVQKSPLIIEDIKAFNDGIIRKLQDKFDKFKELTDIKIHPTEPNSWNPKSITQTGRSLIKNANYKKKIKNDILVAMGAIITLRDGYKIINEDIDEQKDIETYINDFLSDWLVEIQNYNINFYTGKYINKKNLRDTGQSVYNYKLILEKSNDNLRHKEVIDNASSLINFNKLTYLGGHRQILVDFDEFTIDEELRILTKLGTFNQQLLFLLYDNQSISKLSDLSRIPEIIINMEGTLSLLTEKIGTDDAINDELTKFFNYFILSVPADFDINGLINLFTINLFTINYALCVIIIYFSIIDDKLLLNDNFIIKLKKILKDNYKYNDENSFLNKWLGKLYNYNYDFSLYIYEIFCDLFCFTFSNNNLSYDKFPFKIIALVTGINNQPNYIIKGVYNAYKPHLIYYTLNNPAILESIKHSQCVLYLLDENFNENYNIDIPTEDSKYEDYINGLNIKDDLKKLVQLFFRYTTNEDKSKFDKNEDEKTDDVYNYFHTFKKYNMEPVDVFRTIILSIYNELENKPLNQTLNDFIYLLDKDPTDLQKISILWYINNKPNDTNIELNQPSYQGYFNYLIDRYSDNKHHFMIAHVMGLYYEGRINMIELKLDPNIHTFNNIRFKILTAIDDNKVPFLLNYLISLNGITPYNYYSIPDNKVRLPTTNNIYITYYKKIKYYQTSLKSELNDITGILDELSNGKSDRLEQIFYNKYFDIIFLNRQLEHFCTAVDKISDSGLTQELAKNLNKINAMYYIYYYLKTIKSGVKEIKIEKFNNYLLDHNIFSYYDSSNEFIDSPMIGGKYLYKTINELYNQHKYGTKFYKTQIPLPKPNDESLPPSLFNELSTFYNYGLVETIKNIIEKLEELMDDESEIVKQLDKYIKSLKLNVSDSDLGKYLIIAKLIEELVREQSKTYISEAVVKYYQTRELENVEDLYTIIKVKEFPINLTSTSIVLEFDELENVDIVKNMFSVMKKSKKSDDFVIYPNDFTNTGKFKVKYSFNINDKVIETLLQSNSLLFKTNLENNTPIYSLLKINNNKIMRFLETQLDGQYNITLKNFEDDNKYHLSFMKQECQNNLNKVLNGYNQIDPIKKVFQNINGHLYNDIKALIISNENFGNNILLYLEESFSICSYLTLQYLGEHLINIDTEFTLDDAKKLLSVIGCEIDDINKNYLGENLKIFKIDKYIEDFMARQLYKDKETELKMIQEKIKNDEKISSQFKDGSNLKRKFLDSYKYKSNSERENKLKRQFEALRDLVKKPEELDNYSTTEPKIIKRYDELDHEYSITYAWSELLNREINNNYNLLLITVLLKQKEIIENEQIHELEDLNKGLKHISNLCEDYFNKKNIIKDNKILGFIYDMVEYLTKIVICNGIEYTMRRILFTFYTNQIDSLLLVNDKINYILNTVKVEIEKIKDLGKSLHEILFDDICKRLVKSSTSIYQDKDDELIIESTRDILTEFFDHLKVFPDLNDIKVLFDSEVISYFETFVSRTILLWMVNAENIFKYFINNYRSTDILLLLSNDPAKTKP